LPSVEGHTLGEASPPQGEEEGTQPVEGHGREGLQHTARQYRGEHPRLGRPLEDKEPYLEDHGRLQEDETQQCDVTSSVLQVQGTIDHKGNARRQTGGIGFSRIHKSDGQ